MKHCKIPMTHGGMYQTFSSSAHVCTIFHDTTDYWRSSYIWPAGTNEYVSGWRCGELWWWWRLGNDASGGNVAGLKGSVSQPTVMSACEIQNGGGGALGIELED